MLRRAITLAVAALAAAAMNASPVLAHETRPVGNLEVVVGWLEEPAYAGFRNAVSLNASRGGQPVEGGTLEVEVFFGTAEDGTPGEPMELRMELRPAFGEPGEYRAFLIPTRPGTYAFHVTGRLGGRAFDEAFTSGEDTFNDIEDSREAEFPAQDPSRGELAQRAEQIDERLAAARADVEEANEAADQAKLFGYVAIGLGAIALLLAILRRPKVTKG